MLYTGYVLRNVNLLRVRKLKPNVFLYYDKIPPLSLFL